MTWSSETTILKTPSFQTEKVPYHSAEHLDPQAIDNAPFNFADGHLHLSYCCGWSTKTCGAAFLEGATDFAQTDKARNLSQRAPSTDPTITPMSRRNTPTQQNPTSPLVLARAEWVESRDHRQQCQSAYTARYFPASPSQLSSVSGLLYSCLMQPAEFQSSWSSLLPEDQRYVYREDLSLFLNDLQKTRICGAIITSSRGITNR